MNQIAKIGVENERGRKFEVDSIFAQPKQKMCPKKETTATLAENRVLTFSPKLFCLPKREMNYKNPT